MEYKIEYFELVLLVQLCLQHTQDRKHTTNVNAKRLVFGPHQKPTNKCRNRKTLSLSRNEAPQNPTP